MQLRYGRQGVIAITRLQRSFSGIEGCNKHTKRHQRYRWWLQRSFSGIEGCNLDQDSKVVGAHNL